MKIVMGDVIDYFRPTEDMTLCEFLTSPSTDKSSDGRASEEYSLLIFVGIRMGVGWCAYMYI